MSRGLKIKLIVLAILFELIVLSLFNPYPHGMAWDVSYRRHERMDAFFNYVQHQSSATTATWQQELRLLHRHEDWKGYLAFGLLVAINGAAIYFFLHHESKTPSA